MNAILMAFPLVSACLAGAAPDVLDGPWATFNGNNAGTASTDAIPYTLGEGPVRIAWTLDVRAEGQDRVAGRNPITFDSEGNLYWKTSISGGTGGIPRIVSASPDGEIRWVANDGEGAVHGLGGFYDGTAAVVGKNAVYALGSLLPEDEILFVAAYDKATGTLLWQSELDGAVSAAQGDTPYADLLTPVLHEGKLYVVAPSDVSYLPQNLYRVNAEDGEVDWMETFDEIAIRMGGQMTFVPEAFGPGEHGLYFHGDSGSGGDGVAEVYALMIDDGGGEFAWAEEGGKVARSHLIYSEVTETLYAHTWSDYGAELYTYSPDLGFLAANTNVRETGHGFYDVGCLTFDGEEIIAGGFQGLVIRYTDIGDGRTENVVAFDDENLSSAYWGEYRIYGQLLQDPDGHAILISGTNSDTDSNPDFSARVVAIDVTAGELLWEFDTGIVQNHGFTVRGGPFMGPDGKIYYFHAVTGELVALEGEAPPLPMFIRGDTDGNGVYGIGDAIQILERIFSGRDAFTSDCDDAGDIDDNGTFIINDAILLLNYIFGGEPKVPPSPPVGACGVDPTPDDGAMDCRSTSPACR
jgi:outer membrane protein assembly factor BamB